MRDPNLSQNATLLEVIKLIIGLILLLTRIFHRKKRRKTGGMMSLPQNARKLSTGGTSSSMPEYLLMDMTLDDDYLISQRHRLFLSRKHLDASNLPPPSRFRQSSNAQDQLKRTFSTGTRELSHLGHQLRFAADIERSCDQVPLKYDVYPC